MTDERLSACPFCGGDAVVAKIFHPRVRFKVICVGGCGASQGELMTERIAIDTWNQRHDRDSAD